MKPKTEEFLYFLLWSAELLMRPTFRNLTDSYEQWAYRNGLLRQTARLESLGLIERSNRGNEDRLFRLTEAGRLHALGGRDPSVQWARNWDGVWRMVLFDVPVERNRHRRLIRDFLRARSFGCLQGSVWISPDPLKEIRQQLQGGAINVNSLILLEATPQGGENEAQIVAGAWDFEKINQRYAEHLTILDQFPRGDRLDSAGARTLQRWAARERGSWLNAVCIDPLLPKALLPEGYMGRQAWNGRVQALRAAKEQLQTYGK